MRSDPVFDTLTFLTAAGGDQLALGSDGAAGGPRGGRPARRRLRLIAGCGQRTSRDLGLIAARFLIGLMWFQNLFRKLPVSTENGLRYWTGLETKDAAFAVRAADQGAVAAVPELPDPQRRWRWSSPSLPR
jgi:hypothetical protein